MAKRDREGSYAKVHGKGVEPLRLAAAEPKGSRGGPFSGRPPDDRPEPAHLGIVEVASGCNIGAPAQSLRRLIRSKAQPRWVPALGP
jgi:hypothetical protein